MDDQVVERLNGVGISVINKVPLNSESLEQLPELKLIAVEATGLRHDRHTYML